MPPTVRVRAHAGRDSHSSSGSLEIGIDSCRESGIVTSPVYDYDYAIVGQGLAGTQLAWRLFQRGKRVVLIDRDEAVTASKAAAGLVNPITGQRINLSWRLHEFLPVALEFYRYVEDDARDSVFSSHADGAIASK